MNRSKPWRGLLRAGSMGGIKTPCKRRMEQDNRNCALEQFRPTRRTTLGDSLRHMTGNPDLTDLHRPSQHRTNEHRLQLVTPCCTPKHRTVSLDARHVDMHCPLHNTHTHTHTNENATCKITPTRPTAENVHVFRRRRRPSWTCACGTCASTRASSRCAWPNAWPSSCRPSSRPPSCARNVSSAPWFKRHGTTGATQLLRTRPRGGAVENKRCSTMHGRKCNKTRHNRKRTHQNTQTHQNHKRP